MAFHKRVRAGYLAIARSAPDRIKLVRADQSIEELQGQIRALITRFCVKESTNDSITTPLEIRRKIVERRGGRL